MPSSRTSSDLSGLVASLYEAANTPDSWTAALDGIGDRLGGATVVIGLHRPSGMAFGTTHRLDPERQALLKARYVQPETNPLFAAMPRLPVLAPISRQRLMEDDSYLRSGLFNEVFKPDGYTHVSVSCLARENGVMISCGLLRRIEAEFTAEHAHIFEALLPHLRRAMELTVCAKDHESARLHAASAADVSLDGLVIVDAEARALYCNTRGGAILDRGDGLCCRGGRLHAQQAADGQRLHQAIRSAANRSGHRGGNLRIRRRDDLTPWAVIVTPPPGDAHKGGGSALLRVIDLDLKPAAPTSRLMELFNLSHAEARLALDLAEGVLPEVAAERHGVEISTIRTQIRSILTKTGAPRQIDLIRMLMQVVGS